MKILIVLEILSREFTVCEGGVFPGNSTKIKLGMLAAYRSNIPNYYLFRGII
jgi:hypothetical protein